MTQQERIEAAPERIWTIDLDGTGSMHPASNGDPGAVDYIRADKVAEMQAAIDEWAEARMVLCINHKNIDALRRVIASTIRLEALRTGDE